MSWNVSIPVTPGAEILDKLDAVTMPEGHATWAPAEMGAQLAAAKAAAKSLIESGALGSRDGGTFYVYLGGHSNPEHAKVPGWADDMVNVTVNRSPTPEPKAGE